MNEFLVTIGCIMAEVIELDACGITSSSEGEVKLTFFPTSESVDNRIVLTNEMRALCNLGFFPIAIVRISPHDPGTRFLFALPGLSVELRLALEHQGCDLVHTALICLADGRDGSIARK
jgi:hypothetical protein